MYDRIAEIREPTISSDDKSLRDRLILVPVTGLEKNIVSLNK